jgi:hypothetical protein
VRALNECARSHSCRSVHSVWWCAHGHKGAQRECTRARNNVRSIALVQVCVRKLGICARANMSELEHRHVSRIECTICVLEPRVLVMKFKQNKINSIAKIFIRQKTNKKTVFFFFTPLNLNDALSPMWQDIQYRGMRNRNVQRPRHPPNLNTKTPVKD